MTAGNDDNIQQAAADEASPLLLVSFTSSPALSRRPFSSVEEVEEEAVLSLRSTFGTTTATTFSNSSGDDEEDWDDDDVDDGGWRASQLFDFDYWLRRGQHQQQRRNRVQKKKKKKNKPTRRTTGLVLVVLAASAVVLAVVLVALVVLVPSSSEVKGPYPVVPGSSGTASASAAALASSRSARIYDATAHEMWDGWRRGSDFGYRRRKNEQQQQQEPRPASAAEVRQQHSAERQQREAAASASYEQARLVWERDQDRFENVQLLVEDIGSEASHWLSDRGDELRSGADGAAKYWSAKGAEWRNRTSDWWNDQGYGKEEHWKKVGKDQKRYWKSKASEWKSKGTTWWNASVSDEEEWYRATMLQLESFGYLIRSWWDDRKVDVRNAASKVSDATAATATELRSRIDGVVSRGGDSDNETLKEEVKERVDVIERKFGDWYEHASDAEKAWWADTVDAFSRFENRSETFWNLTRHAVADKFREEAAKDEERSAAAGSKVRNWWNGVRDWFRHPHRLIKSRRRSSSDESGGFRGRYKNATEYAEEKAEEVMEAINATMRNMTSTTSQDVELWWEATRQWFESHRLIQRFRNSDANATATAADGTSPGIPPDDAAFFTPLLYFNTTRAYQLVMSNQQYGWFDFSVDFFRYQRGWDAQQNQAYCGVASAAAVLNSLLDQDDLPVDPAYDPHPYATQTSLLLAHSRCVNKRVITYNGTYDGIFHFPGGLSLAQTAGLLNCNLPSSMEATMVYADNVTLSDFRANLQQALTDPGSRVIVNFDRSVLDQEGGGHFSPVAGYSPSADAFLIMDVAKYKYPPAWVPTHRLFKSLRKQDRCAAWDLREARHSSDPDLLSPRSDKDIQRAAVELNCRSGSRGYIVVHDSVEQRSDEDEDD